MPLSHLTSSAVVLRNGYVGKRTPETWTIEQLVDNMRIALQFPSRHVPGTPPKRPQLPTGCDGCVVEYLKDNPVVKVFYDWDAPVPQGSLEPLSQITTDAQLEEALASLIQMEHQHLALLSTAMKSAHPKVADADFAYASRSGWKIKKTRNSQPQGSWVISLRCFVQGIAMRLGDIATHINNTFPKSTINEALRARAEPYHLDRTVYKESEQCLAIVGGHKTSLDQRVLIPLTHLDNLAAFIVQVSFCFCALTRSWCGAKTLNKNLIPQHFYGSGCRRSDAALSTTATSERSNSIGDSNSSGGGD